MHLEQVKSAMIEKARITYDGIECYVSGCTMRIRNGAWYYQLELASFKTSSVIIANMEKVKF